MIEKMSQFNIVDSEGNSLEFSRGSYNGEDKGRRFQIGDFYFTTRELEALTLVNQGLSKKQIADDLDISYPAAKQRLLTLKGVNQKDPAKYPPGTIAMIEKAKGLGLLNPIVLVALKGLDKKDS